MFFGILCAAVLLLGGAVLALWRRTGRLAARLAALETRGAAGPAVSPEEEQALERWNQGVAGVMAYEVRR